LTALLTSFFGGAETLVLLAEDDAAPWSLADGTSYANDLVQAIYGAVDVDVELKVLPYTRAKRMTIAGTVARCFNMAREEKNEKRTRVKSREN
jgi:polar amino acid transport system substrate-binding protein